MSAFFDVRFNMLRSDIRCLQEEMGFVVLFILSRGRGGAKDLELSGGRAAKHSLNRFGSVAEKGESTMVT